MPRGNTSPVIAHLLREEANAVQLYLQYKGYHWNVAGPWFRELHLLFDEHAAMVFAMIDPLAERQRMLGAPAPYTMGDLGSASKLPKETGLPGTTRAMVERLLVSHRTIIEGMHEGFRAAEREGDPGTADLFARFVQDHQKMEWFLRELASEAPPMPEEAGRPLIPAEKGTGLPSSLTPHAPTHVPGR
ncbi:MAG TPA: DNA starvation/stationary phase protection protein [Thermoplasmata archaeon]|nr:DNA starvation/stationary phase protection protein [Thermoplasmata archaeon]